MSNQFENQNFDAYGSSIRSSNNAFPEALVVFPSIQAPVLAENSEISHTRHLMDLLGASNESNHHQPQPHGLSLSLGSDMFVHSEDYRHHQPSSLNQAILNPNYFMSGQESREEACNPGVVDHHVPGGDYAFTTTPFASSSTSYASVIGNSRYLRPLQSLLEELVDVGGNVVDRMNERYVEKLSRGSKRGARRLSSELRAELCNHGVLVADKHELQAKIGKLIALLDEVEGRYETYYHQMEEVMSSFEMIAGVGAAKCYTALALQAMSRHFCTLRDSIVSQINMEKRKLFQDLPKISNDLSQLSLFDRERRQNRLSLQHLGLIQSQRQVWRPIRGLPETSVAILRSWLFEHFLHPYPNDSEKLMLASQIGLTKNQVSNWFINARVRLWKPMIEEMYKDEFGDSSDDSNRPPTNKEDTTDRVEDSNE